jgi:tetratricopeptide (TPR) repeat protein
VEAKVFQALALILAQPPYDAYLVEMKQAVQILTPLLAEYPNHPGIAHYLIHASDAPGMAQDGLEAARRYAQIAPAAPHALHMPSHIFARLGLWQEDIQSNLASEAAAEKVDVGGENRLHAMEFLEYAYLQIGHDNDAQAIMAEAKTISEADVDSRYGSYYPVVQTRFRTIYAIETKDWVAAARMAPTPGGEDAGEGLTLLTHAMAAGHLKNRTLAAQTLSATADRFKKRHKDKPLPQSGTPEAGFIDEIHAWKDFTDGKVTAAIQLLRPVADREAKEGKGELDLPVREMIAEMLLLSGFPEKALQEYELSLKTDPNRFNALLGAGNAAEQAGRGDLARDYYRQLLNNCAGATGPAVQALARAKLLNASTRSSASVER